MPKVVGIGGVFFRAADPAGLAEWYEVSWDQRPAQVRMAVRGRDNNFRAVLREYRLFWTSRTAVDDQLPRR